MAKYVIMIFLTLLVFSCNEKKGEENAVETQEIKTAQDLKKVEVEIEGMTCEIGCAKLIESKLSKLEGVIYVKVDFESRLGKIEFDANQTNTKELVKTIASAGGGDLYSVSNQKEVDQF